MDMVMLLRQISTLVRSAALWVIGVLAVVCLLDWLVRTRRINPFHPVARFLRDTVDPMIAPMERRIVRAGGTPSSAPWWTLAAAVVLAILVITAVNFVAGELTETMVAMTSGPVGIFVLLVQWTFELLRAALVVRVVVSYLPISPYSPWVRWAFVLSEPMLRPLRGIIPTLGAFDITPIVAYFVLGLLEGMLLRLIRLRR
jgi:YggT family protein